MKKDDKAIIVIIENNKFRVLEVFNKNSRKIIDEGGDYDGMDIDEYIEQRENDYAFSKDIFSYVIFKKEDIKNMMSMIDLD